MELLGEANWWLPGWLQRILPRINVEGGPPLPERPDGDSSEDTPAPALVR